MVLLWTTSPWLPPFIAIVSTFLDCGDGRSLCYHCCDAESWPVVPKSSWLTTIQMHHDGNAANAILVVRYHLGCGVCLAVYLNKGEAMRRTRTKKETKEGRQTTRSKVLVLSRPTMNTMRRAADRAAEQGRPKSQTIDQVGTTWTISNSKRLPTTTENSVSCVVLKSTLRCSELSRAKRSTQENTMVQSNAGAVGIAADCCC